VYNENSVTFSFVNFVALHKDKYLFLCCSSLQDCSFWSDLYLHDIARGVALFLEAVTNLTISTSKFTELLLPYNSSRYTSNLFLALGQHAFHTSLFYINNIHMPVMMLTCLQCIYPFNLGSPMYIVRLECVFYTQL
jgi:hypothetical protein